MKVDRSQRKYIVILAVVCALILVIGARFKPGRSSDAPIAQSELQRLQRTAQRRDLEDLTSFFADTASSVRQYVVWIRGLEASGIVWDDDGLLVSASPSRATRRTPTAGPHELAPDVVSVHYPASALRAPPESEYREVPQAPASAVAQGSWVVQVSARTDGGYLHAPGMFEGLVQVQCGEFRVQSVETNLPLAESSAGGGIFDLSGNLLGVVLRCGGNYIAVTPEGIDRMLEAARSDEGMLLRRYGFRAEPMLEDLQAHFKTDRGLLVNEVWSGWPADVAGLLPGDVIQALDDVEVLYPHDLARLMLPVAYPTFDLWVKRWGNTKRLSLPVSHGEFPDPGPESPGIVLGSPLDGYLIEEVAPGSRAERAELEPGDRLLFIDGSRPSSLAAARRVLAEESGAPVYLVVQRGSRKLGAYLSP